MGSKIKISIRWKIFFLVAILISIGIAVVTFQTNSVFSKDKSAFVKDLNNRLASGVSKNASLLIKNFQDKLIIFISSKESLGFTGTKLNEQLPVLFARYNEFYAIGLFKTQSSNLVPDWFLKNPLGAAKDWPDDFGTKIFSGVKVDPGSKVVKNLWRLPGPDGKSLLALGFNVQVLDVKKSSNGDLVNQPVSAWIVGILPPNTFDFLLQDFTTGLNTGFIIDERGNAVSHPDPTLSGTDLSSHPMVSEVLKSSMGGATGDFLDEKGRAIIGSFEKVENLNLTVMVTTPRDKAFEAAHTLMKNILYMGIAILIISLAAAIIMSNLMTQPLEKLAQAAAEIGAGNFNYKINVQTNDEIGDLANSFAKMEQGLIDRDTALSSAQQALVQSEKMSAFGQLSAGIAHEVKNPLAGILGHAQLAMGKSVPDDVKKHLEVIEKETRRCKAIVENLMRFARAEKAQMAPTNLSDVVQDTINLVDHQLSLAGCRIEKDFQTCPQVLANANQVQQVLLNLMVNASHAMEKAENKVVTVRVLQAGNKAQIQVADCGAGIPPEIQKKIFEPFFTTKPAGKGTGLGLSVSIGIVKDHKGEIYLKSQVGVGTTFFIDFPIPTQAELSNIPKASEPEKKEIRPTSSMEVDLPSQKPKIPEPTMAIKAKPVERAPQRVAPTASLNLNTDEFFSDARVTALRPTVSQIEAEDGMFFGVKKEKPAPTPQIKAVEPQLEKPKEPTPVVVAKAAEENTGEFKVKITRPKIKA